MSNGDYIKEVNVKTAEGVVLSTEQIEFLEGNDICVGDDGVWKYVSSGEPTQIDFFDEADSLAGFVTEGSYIEMEGSEDGGGDYRLVFSSAGVEAKCPVAMW